VRALCNITCFLSFSFFWGKILHAFYYPEEQVIKRIILYNKTVNTRYFEAPCSMMISFFFFEKKKKKKAAHYKRLILVHTSF
jgi:hypothetical protein